MKFIELISIPVTDQERAKEFYLKLGLEIIVESKFQDMKWIQLGFPGQDASITLVNWFPNMPAGCIDGLIIKTDDIAAEIKSFNEKGIEVGEIGETPWGKFAEIKDPDGNRLSLHEG